MEVGLLAPFSLSAPFTFRRLRKQDPPHADADTARDRSTACKWNRRRKPAAVPVGQRPSSAGGSSVQAWGRTRGGEDALVRFTRIEYIHHRGLLPRSYCHARRARGMERGDRLERGGFKGLAEAVGEESRERGRRDLRRCCWGWRTGYTWSLR